MRTFNTMQPLTDRAEVSRLLVACGVRACLSRKGGHCAATRTTWLMIPRDSHAVRASRAAGARRGTLTATNAFTRERTHDGETARDRTLRMRTSRQLPECGDFVVPPPCRTAVAVTATIPLRISPE